MNVTFIKQRLHLALDILRLIWICTVLALALKCKEANEGEQW
jgi:hypothetical protein